MDDPYELSMAPSEGIIIPRSVSITLESAWPLSVQHKSASYHVPLIPYELVTLSELVKDNLYVYVLFFVVESA